MRLRDVGTVTMHFTSKERFVDPLEERISAAVGPTTARDVVEVLDDAGLRAEVWSLFDAWESLEHWSHEQAGVGPDEYDDVVAQIEARRSRLVALIGDPNGTDSAENTGGDK